MGANSSKALGVFLTLYCLNANPQTLELDTWEYHL